MEHSQTETEDSLFDTKNNPERLAASAKLHEAITRKLEELELTVSEFADILDVRNHVIYLIKSKGTLPNTENLAKICLALNININEILSPFTPTSVSASLKEYAQKRKQVESAQAVYDRQKLELDGVLKKLKLKQAAEA